MSQAKEGTKPHVSKVGRGAKVRPKKRIKGEDLRFFQLHTMQNGAARFTVQK